MANFFHYSLHFQKAFQKVMTKRNTKPRWPMSKIHKTLDEWCDGSLTGSELTILREELIILEVEKSSKEYRSEMKVSRMPI